MIEAKQEHEIRRRLVEAQGWTYLKDVSPCGLMHGLWGTEPAGWFSPGSNARPDIIAPDPLNDEHDSAKLLSWCVSQDWCCRVTIVVLPDLVDAVIDTCVEAYGEKSCIVYASEGSDLCHCKRLALCRAVLQALEVQP